MTSELTPSLYCIRKRCRVHSIPRPYGRGSKYRIVRGGNGNDVVKGSGAASFFGEGDNDDLRAPGVASSANGGSGVDTCQSGFNLNCEVIITPTPTP